MNVLFPTDGEPHSLAASRRFFDLFRIEELEAEIVTVLEEPGEGPPSEVEERKREAEHEAKVRLNVMENELARPPSAVRAEVLRGEPAAEVVARAEAAGADLLVLGSRGVREPDGLRVGSVALEIARSAPCSVMVVREG